MKLNNWKVELCEESGEWVCTHYVGGEDYEIVDDFFGTPEEAEEHCERLNLLAEEYTHTDYEGRQAESDGPIFEAQLAEYHMAMASYSEGV